MKKKYTKVLKELFSAEISKVRYKLSYSQAKMAECLMISERSYFDLEREKYCCGALTLLLFLFYYCPEPIMFLTEVKSAFDNIIYDET